MDDDHIIEGIIEEIEKACAAINKRENVVDINKADKILISILNGNSNFCCRVAFRLLNSQKDTPIKEFAAYLLYHTLKSTIKPKNYDKVAWDWTEELVLYIVDADSELLRQKLCRCLCLLTFAFDPKGSRTTPKMLLEVIVKASIQKNIDPDTICLSFFTSLAEEYNQTFPTDMFLPDSQHKIRLFVRDVQAHSVKILNYDEKQKDLKLLVFKCIDSWLQHILTPKYLHFSLIVKVLDCLLDEDLTVQAFTVIQSLVDLNSNSENDFQRALCALLTKCLVYTFPYLTLAGLNQLNEIVCETTVQQNVLTCFVSFCTLHLLGNIDDEVINLHSFNDSLKIMYRLTAIGSFSGPPFVQPIDYVVSPFQFWNDFFDNPSVKRNVTSVKFNYLFAELFYIFVQRATLYPSVIENPQLTDLVIRLRREIACIFRKMASLSPDTFLDNIYVTYKLYEKQCLGDPKNAYLLEVAAFVLGSIISVLPITDVSLPLLKDIYGSIPSLLSVNPSLIAPFFSLLGKSAKVIATVLSPVFSAMVVCVTNYIVGSYNGPFEQQRQLIVSSTEFIATVLDQVDFKLDPSLSANLIRLFGELFGLTFIKIRHGQSTTAFLSDNHRKSYVLMAKIVVRALSCMYLDGSLNDVEAYVSNLIKEVIDFFEMSLSEMASNPLPSRYKDVFLLLQIIHEIAQGLLVDSNSGKGALKMLFERFFDRSLFITAYYCIWNSEMGVKLLMGLVKKCIYKGFGIVVSKVALNNFVNYNISLVLEDRWQLLPVLTTYISVLHGELGTLTDPIDFVFLPIVSAGTKYLMQPNWPNAPIFFQFLVDMFKIVPANVMLYNYISLESARILVLQLLDYSQLETWPEASQMAVKCLKQFVRCSFGVTDGNILLLSKQSQFEGVSLLEHIFMLIFNQMLVNGATAVILYYPIITTLYSQSSNDFMNIFYKALFSQNVPPNSLDTDTKHAFYWKFVDCAKNKEAGLDLMLRFFSAASNKCKM